MTARGADPPYRTMLGPSKRPVVPGPDPVRDLNPALRVMSGTADRFTAKALAAAERPRSRAPR